MAPQFVKRWLGNRQMWRAVGRHSTLKLRWMLRSFRPCLEQLEVFGPAAPLYIAHALPESVDE